jgi:hypothetical protein
MEQRWSTNFLHLQNHLRRDGLGLLERLPEPKETYDDALERLKEYLQHHTRILAERRALFLSIQAPSESSIEWTCRVRRMVVKFQ